MNKVKIAILGTGNVAHNIARAILQVKTAQLWGVASLNVEDAEGFAKKYDISNVYKTYEEAAADTNVNLIYIAVPHPFHCSLTKMCLNAGKNVLCEKPIAVNAKQAEEMFKLAKERGLYLAEAIWPRFLPAVKIVKSILSSGVIGEVKHFIGTFGYDLRNVKRMIDPHLAGGILLDCGIYLLMSMEIIMGKDIKSMVTQVVLSEEGIDLCSTTAFEYDGDRTASLMMSMDSFLGDAMIICGDKGRIEMQCPHYWNEIKVYVNDMVEEKAIPKDIAGGYEYEVESICGDILERKLESKVTSYENTMFVMKLMDEMREKWGMKYPCE